MSNHLLECDPNDLFEAGALFLFLDVPPNTEFGIDYNCWRTGPQFKGVKMIPPGIHFVYYSVTDKYGNVGLRNGFFYNFKFKEIVARKWDVQNECIDTTCTFSIDELERFECNKREMDKFLGAYPFDEYKRWKSLTSQFEWSFLINLIPEVGIISSGSSLIGNEFKSSAKRTENSVEMVSLSWNNLISDLWTFNFFFNNKNKKSSCADMISKESIQVNTDILKKPESLNEAEKMLPEMKEQEKMMIRFTKLSTFLSYPPGSRPDQVTKCLIDQSYKLEQLIEFAFGKLPMNVLCELQFAFVCFLIGQVYEAFEQWKLIISLLCNSEQSILKHPNMFAKFVQCIYFQLKEMPDDFFTDILTRNNFLTVNLHNLFDNVKQVVESNPENTAITSLEQKCIQFKTYLEDKFELKFEMEPDEYAPQMVELNE
jgi:A1 cistron-splicing factor AAR2